MSGDDHERIALALQGGGTHGGFIWDLLDRLSHDCELAISAISGSSGALTAAQSLRPCSERDRCAPGDACVLDPGSPRKPCGPEPFCRRVMVLRLRNISHLLSVWIEQLAVLTSPYIFPFLTNPLGRVA